MKITANGITVQYDVEGPVNTPVVTLSHSLAANLHLWDAQAAALRDRYHVLRYDVRGTAAPRCRRAPTPSSRWPTTSTTSCRRSASRRPTSSASPWGA